MKARKPEKTKWFQNLTEEALEFYRVTRSMTNWQRTQWNRWQRNEHRKPDGDPLNLAAAVRFSETVRP